MREREVDGYVECVIYELLGCKRTEYGGGAGGDEVLVVSSRQKFISISQ